MPVLLVTLLDGTNSYGAIQIQNLRETKIERDLLVAQV